MTLRPDHCVEAARPTPYYVMFVSTGSSVNLSDAEPRRSLPILLGRIRGRNRGGAVLLLLALFIIVGLAVGLFFFAETDLSLSKISWRHRFEHDLKEKGEVRLGELVTFNWNKIYFIESYSPLNSQQEAELFPRENLLDPFWWSYDRRYWTIAYQRPGRAPFLIRVRNDELYLRKRTNLSTTDPEAKLRLVPPNTIETTYCTRRRGLCLGLDDFRSKIPTTPPD